MPFGPDISWPHGFRQLDPQSREVLESAYDTGPVYQQPAMDDYGYGDPGYSDPSYDGPRNPYAGPAFPGESGAPRTPSAGPRAYGGPGYREPDARVPGYHVPDVRDSSRPGYAAPGYASPDYASTEYASPDYASTEYAAPEYPGSGYAGSGYSSPGYAAPGYQPRDFAAPPAAGQDIYPVTGAQEALRDTGPLPLAAPWAPRDSAGFGKTGTSAYPEQWYDHPRLGDQGRDGMPAADPRPADPRPSDLRPGDSRPADPRLEGIRYDELRYDEPSAGPGFDERLDDDSWYEELRRSAPAYPQTSGDQPHPSGPVRRLDPQAPSPQAPSYGQQSGYQQPPASERSGYSQPRGDRGSSGPQMNAGRVTSPGPRPGAPSEKPGGSWLGAPVGTGTARPSGSPFSPGAAGQSTTSFLSAPAAHVGVLTPPNGSRIDALQESIPPLASPGTGQFMAPPAVGRPSAGRPSVERPSVERAAAGRTAVGRPGSAVRPGHGLDGPAITSSWPAQPSVDEPPDSFEDFWADDDDNAEYKGLFGDRDTSQDGDRQAKRRIGRRRGGSNDHRLWLGLGGVVIVAAAAITGIIKFEFPSHSGPVHAMQAPTKIGTYVRTVDLEHKTDLGALRNEVIKMSAGQATNVVSGVYESGNSAAGNTEQIVMFIGGHLANAAPATSIAGFTQKYPGAKVVSAGSGGGEAACVEEGGGTSESVSMCAWFDNDSFGEVISPTMKAAALAKAMVTMRPSVEIVKK